MLLSFRAFRAPGLPVVLMALMFVCAGCLKIYGPPRNRGRCPDCQRDYYAEKRERRRMRRSAEKAAADSSVAQPSGGKV
jgi:hypothetical protein